MAILTYAEDGAITAIDIPIADEDGRVQWFEGADKVILSFERAGMVFAFPADYLPEITTALQECLAILFVVEECDDTSSLAPQPASLAPQPASLAPQPASLAPQPASLAPS